MENKILFQDKKTQEAPEFNALVYVLDVFKLFNQGSLHGEWEPFLNELSDDVELLVPADGFAEQGLIKGKIKAKELFAYHDGVAGLQWHIKTVMGSGNEIAVEAFVDGGEENNKVALQLLIIFVVDNGKIKQMREYAVHTGKDGTGWGSNTIAYQNIYDYRKDTESFSIIKSSKKAYETWKTALETGDTADFLSMADDDITFAVPMGFDDWYGEQKGKKKIQELVAFEKSEIHKDLKLQKIYETVGSRYAVFSVIAKGISRDNGKEFTSSLLISFTFNNQGLVTDLRESTWDVQPEAIAKQAGFVKMTDV